MFTVANASAVLLQLDARVDHHGMTDEKTAEVDDSDFAGVAREWNGLKDDILQAMADDREEATTFWSELGKRITDLFQYNARREEFETHCRRLIQETELSVDRIETLLWPGLSEHATAPWQLTSDGDAWSGDRRRVLTLMDRCKQLAQEAPGWNDESRDGYNAVVTVQLTALTELAGVMESAAQSCRAGARLNRAIFYVVRKQIIGARKSLASHRSSGGDRYQRTAAALTQLDTVESLIDKAISGAVTDGSARILSDELRRTMEMPHLLTPHRWPSGTAGAGVDPADTGSGVTNDGRDANSHIRGDRGEAHQGIRR